jgi:hypothetical protein
MKNIEKINNQYIYDTPTNIVEKEGILFRGMTSYKKNKPQWVKILTIFFSLVILVFPGIFLSIILFSGGISIITILGPLFLVGGIIAIYQNVRKY